MIIDILLATLWGFPCWLWLLLAGIIPFLLGCLFCRTFRKEEKTASKEKKTTNYGAATFSGSSEHRLMQDKLNVFEKNEADLKYKIEQLEVDLKACRDKRQRLEMQNLEYKAKLEELGALDDKDAALKLATGAVQKSGGLKYAGIFSSDNLQIVEGIGPKVEKILKGEGVSDWSVLATKKPEALRTILVANGLQMMKPDSWPRQAELANNGQWAELIEYQKFLDGGREKTGDFENPAKVEKMAMKMLGFSQNPEDLKIIEGIGPKIEDILKKAGVKTWSDLAGTSVDRLQDILGAAGDRYKLAKPDTWPKQAGMAAAGNWSDLKEYQDYLDKGVDPKA
jgi:predicted flap endonuclease-1-like 5' DNA nuclease